VREIEQKNIKDRSHLISGMKAFDFTAGQASSQVFKVACSIPSLNMISDIAYELQQLDF
jgi:hypothetical protein